MNWQFSRRVCVVQLSRILRNGMHQDNGIGNSREIIYCGILRQHLNCDANTALQLVKSLPQILHMAPKIVKRNASILRNNFSLKDIITHPMMICYYQIHRLENGVHLLKEIGVTDPSITSALSVNAVLKKTVGELKNLGTISSTTNVGHHIISAVDCADEALSVFGLQFGDEREFLDMNVNELRKRITKAYLAWRLECSSADIGRLMKRYKQVQNKSLYLMSRTVTLLLEEVQMPVTKLLSNGWMLAISPMRLRSMITEIPQLGGLNINEVILKCPKILFSKPEDLLEIETYLHSMNITNEQIQRCLRVFCLNPSTLQQKVEQALKVEEFRARTFSLRFLNLVVQYEVAKERLNTLREEECMPVSLDLLTKSASKSNKSRMLETFRNYGKESIEYLSNKLQKDVKAVREQLKQHPEYPTLSLLSTKKVVELLMDHGVTKEQLWLGLPIVSYDDDEVKDLLQRINHQPEMNHFKSWKKEPNFVQILLYLLEKERAGIGKGIFCDTVTFI